MDPHSKHHELTTHRVDPWGQVRLSCTVCGVVGKFQTSTDAYEHHARRTSGTPPPAVASICRGATLYVAP